MFNPLNFTKQIDVTNFLVSIQLAKQMKALGFPQETIHFCDLSTNIIYSSISKKHREAMLMIKEINLLALPSSDEIFKQLDKEIGKVDITYNFADNQLHIKAENNVEIHGPYDNLAEILGSFYNLNKPDFDEKVKSDPNFNDYK